MAYVDGFLIPVAKDKLDAYRAMAQKAGVIWKEHGALEYKECLADDLDSATHHNLRHFEKAADTAHGELVVFSYIVYESRAHRDAVNARVMEDPRLKEQMDQNVFDCRRMAYGGFEMFVDL